MLRFLFVLFSIFYLNIAFGYTVLIDPGHGGKDEGASGLYVKKNRIGKKIIRIKEKDLTLVYAKLIYEKLKSKRYKVFLTRSIDRTVSLEERAEMAEELKADLFISVHFNSSKNHRFSGTEVFYLDNHSNIAVKKVENVENDNLMGDDLIVQQIITDLIVERTVVSSKRLASFIDKNIDKKVTKKYIVKNRGVKPGLFYVLALSKRPAVLLEVGFMSNVKELKKMMKKSFQKTYINTVVDAVDSYMLNKRKKIPSLF